jgi:hypothetical protein
MVQYKKQTRSKRTRDEPRSPEVTGRRKTDDKAVKGEKGSGNSIDRGEDLNNMTGTRSDFERTVCEQHPEMKLLLKKLRDSIDDWHRGWTTAKDTILDIARELDEHNLCDRPLICKTVKQLLRQQIDDSKITEKWVEEVLPSEYKRKYEKSEQSSLSARQLGKSAVASQRVSTAREVEPNQEEPVNYLEQRRNPGNTGGTLGTLENSVGQTPDRMAERTGEESLDENSDNNGGYFSALAEFSGTAVPISGGLASFSISKTEWQDIVVRALEECNSVVRMYFSVKTGALRRVVPDTESTG